MGQRTRLVARISLLLIAGLAAGGLIGCQAQMPPTPTTVAELQPTETATPEPSATPIPEPTETSTPTRTPTSTPTPTPTVEPTSTPDPFARNSKAGEWTIEIPRIDLGAPIITVGWDPDGAIGSPDDPDVVGWFKGGAYPGEAGNAILDGHRDWWEGPRPAIFWDLPKVTPGARIFVYDDGETHIYEVTRNVTYAFDDPDALETIEPSDEPLLTLITCSGVYDAVAHNYGHRTIVQARLLRSY